MPRSLKYPVAVLVILFACVGVAFAAIPDTDGYTYICVNKSSGTMQVREKGDSCQKNETPSRVVSTQAAIPNITTYWRHRNVPIAANLIALNTQITCNDGDVATGGGVNAQQDLEVTGSYPGLRENFPPDQWSVTVQHTANVSPTRFEIYVICQHTA